ncbi:MAG: hypothetical protein ACMXYF_00770 [Candidatus Woesearchaeota archaeon]
MKLHHCAYKISKGNSDLMQHFCEFLGAKLIWEGHDKGREIAMQFHNFTIQFSEMNEKPVSSKNKQETHLAFSSKNPKADISQIKHWFEKNNVETKIGKWSETELWIDCPSIFINFVIEILYTD